MADAWPEDSIQYCCDPWWKSETSNALQRGQLLLAWVPFVDVKPLRMVPEDRGEDPKNHSRIRVCIEPLDLQKPPQPAPDVNGHREVNLFDC